jgi:hypothetical protein
MYRNFSCHGDNVSFGSIEKMRIMQNVGVMLITRFSCG